MKGKLTRVIAKHADIFKLPSTGEIGIRCAFPFNQLYLDEIRTVEGRKWAKEGKYWFLPLTLANVEKLSEWKYQLGAELREWAGKQLYKVRNPVTTIDIPGLQGTLRSYQQQGVIFADEKNGRCLIADEMGLGKTVQALGYIQLYPKKRPVIIVCPAFLKYNWKEECEKWLSDCDVQILSGRPNGTKLTGDIIIVNYDILANESEQVTKDGEVVLTAKGKPKMVEVKHTGWVDYLVDYSAEILILDESHYIKNDTAKRSKATAKLAKNIKECISLSGTPIDRDTVDIYHQIKVINPCLFTNKWTFLHKYCNPKHNGFGWQFKGATNVEELHHILTSNVMIRRLKKDVEKELPDKTFSFVSFDITNRKEYQEAVDKFKQYMTDKMLFKLKDEIKQLDELHGKGTFGISEDKLIEKVQEVKQKATPLAQLEVLKQLAVKGKVTEVLNWIEDFLESGGKLVVFCEHRFTIDAIYEKFKKIAVKVDGSVSAINKQKAKDLFQNDKKIKLFIGNKAAQEGFTLTASSNIAIVEWPWNPGPLMQRIDRVHRIGQKNAVNVYYLMAKNTIEEKIARILDDKMKVLTGVLDGNTIEDKDLITTLINEL